jgi:hypothetical protein
MSQRNWAGSSSASPLEHIRMPTYGRADSSHVIIAAREPRAYALRQKVATLFMEHLMAFVMEHHQIYSAASVPLEVIVLAALSAAAGEWKRRIGA